MFQTLRSVLAGRALAARQRGRERGASAVEYGLLIAGVSAVLAVAVFALGPVIRQAFVDPCDQVASASCTP